MIKRTMKRIATMTLAAGFLFPVFRVEAQDAAQQEETVDRWSISVMGGWLDFETDEFVKDGAVGALSIGYDFSPHWTLEGVVEVCPELKSSYRRDWETGERISRLSEGANRDLSETSSIRFAMDGLLHLAPEARFDPYLAVGLGIAAYEHDFDQRYEPLVRAGAGLFANLSDRWALRLDSRAIVAGADSEFNLVMTAGLVFRPGAPRSSRSLSTVAAAAVVAAAPAAETVKKFELHLNFDPGEWEIKPEYRSELDVIGRFLETQRPATARIEGHEQADEAVAAKDAQILSEKRANAVRDYFKENWKIRSSRMKVTGFGTSRPKDDQTSQRIEVYVTVR